MPEGVLAACRLQAVLVAAVIEAGADLVVPDLHAVLVGRGCLGAGPPDELGESVEVVGEERADVVAPGPVRHGLVVDLLCKGCRLAAGRDRVGGGGVLPVGSWKC